MALWNEYDFSPEREPIPAPDTDPNRYNPLQTYGEFIERFVGDYPTQQSSEADKVVAYDHLLFYGVVSRGNELQDSLLVLRESSDIVAQKRQQTSYDSALKVEKTGYFMATTDGSNIQEWALTFGYWKLAPGFWKSRERCPQDELILAFSRLLPNNPAKSQGGKMWLSRRGGTIQLPGKRDSAWLVGQGIFAAGPQFLDDPLNP